MSVVECYVSKVLGIYSPNLTNFTPDVISKSVQNVYSSYYYITPLDGYCYGLTHYLTLTESIFQKLLICKLKYAKLAK